MDWTNIDLNDSYQRDQNIIDRLSFDVLLLEVRCNISKINAGTVSAQFETDLQNRIISAREIFADNLANIVKQAQKESNNP